MRVDPPRYLNDRLGTVALDDQVGGSIEVQFRDHVRLRVRRWIDFVTR